MPYGVAVDSAGVSLYIADEGNQRVRKVLSGLITTVAGSGTAGCNVSKGAPLSAKLTNPTGVALDGNGNLYIADYGGHCVRELLAKGNLNTVAGSGASGYAGDGGPATSARLSYPTGIFLDSSLDLFIADSFTSVVREVGASGATISTQAGWAGYGKAAGYGGDGGPATSAYMNYVYGATVDSSGDVFIADKNNNRVRETIPMSATTVTFPSSPAGTPVTQNIFLSVNGVPISTPTITPPSSAFAITGTVTGWQNTMCYVDGATTNPNGTVRAVPVTFTPALGSNTATLTVTAPNQPAFTFTLTGQGT